ncbi:hypothetical protein QJS10_CPB15g00133 [Acorus calamus]|uniref:Uncharacterized protein n=1 Tax=Acorus calamus TaxID=4465 RepID=A0AAV9DA39_ACOCL|nr:hypothetical protein QJS10_CPB15g00133 [Acorus calamus]
MGSVKKYSVVLLLVLSLFLFSANAILAIYPKVNNEQVKYMQIVWSKFKQQMRYMLYGSV